MTSARGTWASACCSTVYGAPGLGGGEAPPRQRAGGHLEAQPGCLRRLWARLASRYSGDYGNLPRARFFEAWNEPNLSAYLTPQWHHRKPKSPDTYRKLLNAFYDGVKSVSHKDKVISGGTAPFGDPRGGERMRPVAFVRNLLCLRGHKKLRRKHCGTKAHMDALAHHPINRIRGPRYHALNPDDAYCGDLGRVKRVVRAARRHHTVLPKGKVPLWVTEFWWETEST